MSTSMAIISLLNAVMAIMNGSVLVFGDPERPYAYLAALMINLAVVVSTMERIKR